MASVYRVGKKWRADWTDNSGNRHRQRFATKGEADDYLTTIRAQIKAGTYIAPKDIPLFGAVADEWIAGMIAKSRSPGAGHRPSTLAHWQSHIAHIKASFDNVRAASVDAQAIDQAIAQWRLARAQGGRGLSTRTVAKVLTTLSRVFRYAMANRARTGVQTDFTKVIERLKEASGEQSETGERLAPMVREVTEREVLTPEEAKRVIMATKPGLYRAIIQTGIYTGARISELLALRWQDVNLDAGVVQFRRSLSTAKVNGEVNEKYRWFDPKTKKGIREVPIAAVLIAALKEWQSKCPQSRLGLVFCNGFGEPLDRTGIGRRGLRVALEQAGIDKHVTMHGLRHTYASMLILLGRPITEVSRYLGHANVAITMTVYAHFLKPKKQDTMGDLERLIQNG